jgi:hypothetical protein
MNTTFSYALRMALCQNCGAPIEAAPGGGMFACRYCGAQNQLVARNEQPILAHQPQPLSEAERVMRLRQQDGRPLLPPPSLQSLVPDGQLLPWKVNEAIQVWNSTRNELKLTGNYEAGERLIFLTMVLANHFSDSNDLLRQRAMFESALDVCALPRQKQIMRGYLSRCAARQGDLAAAEQWLLPCDRQSDDLETDSAYRFSRAFIDTARGNYNGVLHVLGSGTKDVPLMDAVDAVCAVLRSNAWERVGQLQTAVALLSEQMQSGAQDRLAIGKIVVKVSRLGALPAELSGGELAAQRSRRVAGRDACGWGNSLRVHSTRVAVSADRSGLLRDARREPGGRNAGLRGRGARRGEHVVRSRGHVRTDGADLRRHRLCRAQGGQARRAPAAPRPARDRAGVGRLADRSVDQQRAPIRRHDDGPAGRARAVPGILEDPDREPGAAGSGKPRRLTRRSTECQRRLDRD